MEYRAHGGYCCGLWHVFGMDESPNSPNTGYDGRRRISGAEALTSMLRGLLPEGNSGRVIEVTTTSEGGQTDNWSAELTQQGFKAVCSFRNSNSRNTVTVWHYHPELTLYGDVPQPGAPVEARQEVRPLLVEYCPNFRLSGRRGMFSSPEAVREQYPLIRQIDRRTVFSDGTITWEENV